MTDLRLTDEALAAIERSALCWLATVDADGAPNVSPKEIFRADGDRALLVANIASPHSARNIRANPAVCVSLVEIFDQIGVKIAGSARLHPRGSDAYARLAPPLAALAGPRFPIRDVIEVLPSKIAPIRAPSYALIPERSDEERRALAYAAYGVRPLDR